MAKYCYHSHRNSLLSSGDYSGETELGESFESTFPARKNLLEQPRMIGVDGGAWTHSSITASVSATGYDGNAQAWTMTGTYSEQSVEACATGPFVFSTYMKKYDWFPGFPALPVNFPKMRAEFANGFFSVAFSPETGAASLDATSTIAPSAYSATLVDTEWWRLSVSFVATDGDNSVRLYPGAFSSTFDAAQLESGSSATAFEDPELAAYNTLLSRRMTCCMCGEPVKGHPPKLYEQNGFMVCRRCLDADPEG